MRNRGHCCDRITLRIRSRVSRRPPWSAGFTILAYQSESPVIRTLKPEKLILKAFLDDEQNTVKLLKTSVRDFAACFNGEPDVVSAAVYLQMDRYVLPRDHGRDYGLEQKYMSGDGKQPCS